VRASDGAPTPEQIARMRTGFTTGACAAAAAKAATRCLVQGVTLVAIETTLPNRTRVTFALARCEVEPPRVTCGVVKDAGDDPDCTHGAELIATVELKAAPGVEIRGGAGVATVTKPGLGLQVGAPAVNPIPRRNITEMVEEELILGGSRGAIVVLSVPGGEEMAKKTLNARLGLLGGISILGTSGIVRPYSTAAYKASILQAIDVAHERGHRELVVTTGGKSEAYAMKIHPELAEEAFIQMGDFVGITLRHCARRGIARALIVGMIGKLSKMAGGKMQTHAAGSEVSMDRLADLAAGLGADAALVAEIRAANTARHVLELTAARGLSTLPGEICRQVVEHGTRHAGGALRVEAELVDFEGRLLGRFPPHDATPRGAGGQQT
jgi:cobalt-precorrin-5B (C1)-methyltransferase